MVQDILRTRELELQRLGADGRGLDQRQSYGEETGPALTKKPRLPWTPAWIPSLEGLHNFDYSTRISQRPADR